MTQPNSFNPVFQPITPAAAASAEQAPTPTEAPTPSFAPAQEDYKRLTPMNFKISVPFSKPLSELNPAHPVIDYPSASRQGTVAAVRRAPNLSIARGAKVDRYANTIREGLEQLPMGDDQDELRGRPDAMFEQVVDADGKQLRGFVPAFKMKEGIKPTGEAARNLVRSRMRLGTVFSVPLWHSGFWITLRALPEGELLELHRRILQDKVELGRATYGMLLSSMTSYSAATMREFMMQHMHSSSLQVPEGDNVFNYVEAPDYQALVWGLACATWPNGYQVRRACVTDVEKCQHVSYELIDPQLLLETDTSSLTTLQKAHMAKRGIGSMTLEQVKSYKDAFLRGRNATVPLGEGMTVTLKNPTLNQYIESSYQWINSLEEQYITALTMDEKARNEYLMSQGQAQAMRQYGHYVHSLNIDDIEIDDPEDLAVSLADLSSNDEIRQNFIEAVRKFQNESQISFFGIPNYQCPACKGFQNPTAIEGQKHELIVLDATQTFFTLMMQKLAKIRQR